MIRKYIILFLLGIYKKKKQILHFFATMFQADYFFPVFSVFQYRIFQQVLHDLA